MPSVVTAHRRGAAAPALADHRPPHLPGAPPRRAGGPGAARCTVTWLPPPPEPDHPAPGGLRGRQGRRRGRGAQPDPPPPAGRPARAPGRRPACPAGTYLLGADRRAGHAPLVRAGRVAARRRRTVTEAPRMSPVGPRPSTLAVRGYQRVTAGRPSPCRFDPELLHLRPRGARAPRRRPRHVAHPPPARPLPPLGWPRAGTRSLNERRTDVRRPLRSSPRRSASSTTSSRTTRSRSRCSPSS